VTAPPVWLLDVDGVINAYRAGWYHSPHVVQVWSPSDQYSYRIRWEPKLVEAINRIHARGLVEMRWSTTWCPDIGALEAALGIGPFETAFQDRPPDLTWEDLKARAALAVLGEGRRQVWTDDVETDAARKRFPQLAEAENRGQALLIAPNPSRGLRPHHIKRIETFLQAGGNRYGPGQSEVP
jgi:hypothetical protein